MPADTRLEGLLDRYQDLLDDGQAPDLAALCRDCPDLRPELERQITRLHRVGVLLGDPPPPPPPEPEPLSLSDDRTWVQQPGGLAPPVEIPAPPGYQVLAPLGEGGMGVVYQARQLGLNRPVALKMILAGARARPVDLARFRAEAQAIAALRHPNIVQVYETGEYHGQPFFSLEFCAGGPLSKALNGEPQPPAAAAALTETLARAVHYAHQQGIVHRDLKPGNVLLQGPQSPVPSPQSLGRGLGTPKISDFGLAKRAAEDSGRTEDGSVLGTPAYMAPEQAFGRPKDIGPATDVHALGAILYELLTGRPPFKGSTVHETLELVRHRDPVPVRDLQPEAPRDLETICLKCLQKDPRRRYPTAEALADDLRRFREGRPILARPVGRIGRLWRWARRDPRTAGLTGAVAALLLLLTALASWHAARLGTAEQLLREHRAAADAARRAERAARDAEAAHRYFAALSEARRLRTEARAGWTWEARARVEAAAAAGAPAVDPEALRSELAAALAGTDLRRAADVAGGMQAGAVTFLPDGTLAVAPQFAQPFNPSLRVLWIDPKTRVTRELPFEVGIAWDWHFPDMVTALVASPNGHRLAMGMRGGSVVLWDLTADPPARASWSAHKGVTALAWSPDSTRLYTAGEDGRVKCWPAAGERKPVAEWPSGAGKASPVTGLAYWPGPRAGVLAHGPAGIRLLHPTTLVEMGRGRADGADWIAPTVEGGHGARLAAHPPTGTIATTRGGRLEVTYWEREVCVPVWRPADPAQEGEAAHDGRIEGMALHPSGLLLATVSPDGGLAKVWHLGTGCLAAAVPAPSGRAVAFSPDGSLLAVGGDHTTTLYEVGGLSAQTVVARRGLPVRAMGRAADGRLATVAARRHPADPDRGAAVATLWDADGRPAETLLHRADGPLAAGAFRVAGHPGGWTAVLAGDGAITWRDPAGRVAAGPAARREHRPADLAFDPAGRCWVVEGGERLAVRPAGSDERGQAIPLGLPGAGRRELPCLRAGGGYVLAGSANGYLRVVRADDQKAVANAQCFDPAALLFAESANSVWAAAVPADGSRAVAGTEDGRLWLFRLPGGEREASWPAHAGRVTAVAVDPTGTWLATGGRDRLVRLWQWDGDSYEPYLTLRSAGAKAVRDLEFDPSGDLRVSHDGETGVRVWHRARLEAAFQAAGVGR